MKNIFSLILLLLFMADALAGHRRWTAADGLPTGEVQQLVELPNGQMLANCEGVFCIANGATFDVVPCGRDQVYHLPRYGNHYAYYWEGDTLLWLRDMYRIFLYDTRLRAFRHDIERKWKEEGLLRAAVMSPDAVPQPTIGQLHSIDSLGLSRTFTCATTDRQGGLWIGTRNDGIVYLSPRPDNVRQFPGSDPLVGLARSLTDRDGSTWRCTAHGVSCEDTTGHISLFSVANVSGLPFDRTTFIQPLADGRYLLCDSLSTLGYLDTARREFLSLNERLPVLNRYRYFVGACPLDRTWTAVYTQNGIFLLNTVADTLVKFPAAQFIETHATKYNCMTRDSDGRLWIGTQNGLFSVADDTLVTRIEGLSNNCIRSLVLAADGNLWAGTSCGISRITPSVINLGREDGIPATAMMERAACCLPDGRLVFTTSTSRAVVFHPDSLIVSGAPHPVVVTGALANGTSLDIVRGIELRYDENYLTIHFSALDYATPSLTSYRYRLLPLETEWNVDNSGIGRCTAAYTALPAGAYTLEAQSATADGEWGETTTLAINILPPLWLTWWAKLAYALAAVGAFVLGVGLYFRRRRLKLERLNEERVNRLFELRDEARHQFAQSINVDPRKIGINRDETELVDKMLKAIGQNMDNLDYNIDQLAVDIGMSRASLYKKTQQMLGITPNEFMRGVRLKHAAHLLAESDVAVNQISLMVGFQTSRYFSQCFKNAFGVLPSEYRAGKAQDETSTAEEDGEEA